MIEQKQVSIFETLRSNPKFHATRSADWFRDKIKELGNKAPIDRAALMQTTKTQQSSRILPGTMIFFAYDPKYKEILPYYDKFPLTFIIGYDRTGFTGLNFHYLPIPLRIKLFDKMWNIAKLSKMPTQQVLQLNWQLLSTVAKFPEVVPCIKRYRFDHVRSKFIKIDIQDWKSAIMLENSEFKKMSASNVRTQSARIAAVALQSS